MGYYFLELAKTFTLPYWFLFNSEQRAAFLPRLITSPFRALAFPITYPYRAFVTLPKKKRHITDWENAQPPTPQRPAATIALEAREARRELTASILFNPLKTLVIAATPLIYLSIGAEIIKADGGVTPEQGIVETDRNATFADFMVDYFVQKIPSSPITDSSIVGWYFSSVRNVAGFGIRTIADMEALPASVLVFGFDPYRSTEPSIPKDISWQAKALSHASRIVEFEL